MSGARYGSAMAFASVRFGRSRSLSLRLLQIKRLSAPATRFITRRLPSHASSGVLPAVVAALSISARALPNPSLKRSANGRPPGPRSAVVYPAPRGPGVLPSSPA